MTIEIKHLASLLLDAYNKGYQAAIDTLSEASKVGHDVELWKEFVEKLTEADKK